MRSLIIAIPVAGLLACMPLPSPRGGGAGGGAGAEPAAAFHCVSGGGRCYSSADACGQSGLQLVDGWRTSCTPSNSAWCTSPERTLCASSESGCSGSTQTGCQLYDGPPPPPPPPPHRPDGPPEVLAVLTSSELDPVARPLFCRYVDGSLDAAGPAQLCPAAQADFQPAKVDPRRDPNLKSWSLRVHLDEFLDGSVATSICTGPECMRLFGGMLELSCDGGRVGILGAYQAGGDKDSDPVGPSLVIRPSSGYPLAAGSTCTLVLGERIVDQSGEPIPGDQRSITFGVASP